MNWERIFLRAVPGLLVVAGALVWSLTNVGNGGVLGLAAISISALMGVAVFTFERRIKVSESNLRKHAARPVYRDIPVQSWRGSLAHERLDYDNVSVNDLSLRSAELVEASFSGASLRNCDLTGANLTHADFTGSLLRRSTFAEGMLRAARLDDVEVRDCDFSGAAMEASSWSGSEIESSRFTDADLSRVNFAKSLLTECDFNRAGAPDADFSRAMIRSCVFTAADLSNADFSQASFQSCLLQDLNFFSFILDRTSIDAQSAAHQDVISQLISQMLALPTGSFWIAETSAGYIQAVHMGDEKLRLEAVNFDSWPAWRTKRRMTEDMTRALEELGLTSEQDNNFYCYANASDSKNRDLIVQKLTKILHDVYGVSEDAPLEIDTRVGDSDAQVFPDIERE